MATIDLTEIGATGLKRSGGSINEEFLPELSGLRAIKTYKEMASNDPIVGAILFAIKMLVRGVNWRVEAGGTGREDKEAAEFLTGCMDDMSSTWSGTISEILSMLPYGWAYHELVYKIRKGDSQDPSQRSKFTDGKIGWRKLPIRAQDTLRRWDFDDAGGVHGMVQSAEPDYRERIIPIEKALLFRTEEARGNPEGRSILRTAYRPWFFKKRIEKIEGIGIERDLAGLPVVSVPPELLATNATAEQKTALQAMERLATQIRRDRMEGVVFPLAYDEKGNKTYELTLLTTGGKRQFDTSSIITRYDQRIAVTVLADFILLGSGSVGSWALVNEKISLFNIALSAWLTEIASVFNRHAIPRLLALNGYRLTSPPVLRHGDVDHVDLKELGEYISKLSGAGMSLFPNEGLEVYLLQQANLPLPTKQGPA